MFRQLRWRRLADLLLRIESAVPARIRAQLIELSSRDAGCGNRVRPARMADVPVVVDGRERRAEQRQACSGEEPRVIERSDKVQESVF